MMIASLYQQFLNHPSICTDTRKIQPNSIFFALKGGNFNGNQFAEKALEEGCSLAIIDEKEFKKDERFILVEDVLTCLQELANFHRKQLKIPVIGITGSNGKTTSKELINAVLSQKFNVLATLGNLNNHIGVPLTLLSITSEHEIAIIEMGANHVGEIAMLSEIAEPEYGMITNIGKAHLEGFGSYENIIKAKSELYQFIKKTNGKLFVNADDELLMKQSHGIEKITFGEKSNAKFMGSLKNPDELFVSLRFHSNGVDTSVESHLTGQYNFYNILAAACIGNYFGLSNEEIKKGIEGYTPTNNRSQWIEKGSNKILLDAYNANPSSMKAAIDNFGKIADSNKVVILGDMLELGNEASKEHTSIIDLVNQKGISQVFLVGPHFMEAGKNSEAKTFVNTENLLSYLKEKPIKNSTTLIKGSRGIQLEKVVDLF